MLKPSPSPDGRSKEDIFVIDKKSETKFYAESKYLEWNVSHLYNLWFKNFNIYNLRRGWLKS